MKKKLQPRIEMFSPFKKPFEDEAKGEEAMVSVVMIAPQIIEYMQDRNTKVVAKCTPCQCCACR